MSCKCYCSLSCTHAATLTLTVHWSIQMIDDAHIMHESGVFIAQVNDKMSYMYHKHAKVLLTNCSQWKKSQWDNETLPELSTNLYKRYIIQTCIIDDMLWTLEYVCPNCNWPHHLVTCDCMEHIICSGEIQMCVKHFMLYIHHAQLLCMWQCFQFNLHRRRRLRCRIPLTPACQVLSKSCANQELNSLHYRLPSVR